MKKPIDHWNASATVATFNHCTPVAENYTKYTINDYTGEVFKLEYKAGGFPVYVKFHPLKGRSDVIRIMSSNWRCEDEPNGIYDIKVARKFYRDLVSIEFEAF